LHFLNFALHFAEAASAGNPVTVIKENINIAVAAIRTCVMQTSPCLIIGLPFLKMGGVAMHRAPVADIQ
jgi:hypothetical protein